RPRLSVGYSFGNANAPDVDFTRSSGAGYVQRLVSEKKGGRPASYLASNNAPASRTAEVSKALLESLGLNGLPFSMPSDLNGSIIARSRSIHGSFCTILARCSKKLAS